MTIILPTVAFAAFCVWLTVRIINRRERWAKRLAIALVAGIPLIYVLSFGPACWWFSKREFHGSLFPSPLIADFKLGDGGPNPLKLLLPRHAPRLYWPIGWLAKHGPNPVSRAICWYASSGTEAVYLPVDFTGNSWMRN